jgi:hypothetical protein
VLQARSRSRRLFYFPFERMPKRKTPAMEEFTLCECVAITGGGLRSPVVLDIISLAEVKYVKVAKSLDWLCQATTGVHYSRWPLKRCQVFSLIEEALVKSSSVPPPKKKKVVDPMTELRGALVRVSGVDDAVQKIFQKDKLIGEISLPSSFGGSDNVSIPIYSPSKTKATYVALECLPRFLAYIASEVDAGGVPYLSGSSSQESPSGGHEEDSIETATPPDREYKYDSRSGHYFAYAVDSEGHMHTNDLLVDKKDSATGEVRSVRSYREEKERVLHELQEWASKI